jgi:hypothetical protein
LLAGRVVDAALTAQVVALRVKRRALLAGLDPEDQDNAAHQLPCLRAFNN